ncbi:hypothetical protein LIT25_15915 [Bacillus sp. F19]|nr:hypothetical protein LIT25_15915 [Bacillus sp. F19]
MNKSENPGADNQDENLDKGFTVKEVASFIDETNPGLDGCEINIIDLTIVREFFM